jgi:predicted ATPase
MRILVKQREWQAALRQYQECRRILEAELEEKPDEVTESLRRAAKGRGTGSAGSAAVRGSAHGGPLVGRSSERAELHRLLLDPARRLITLEGPPGAGKTRLARELLSDLTSHFPDGALFIDLTPLTGEAEVIDAIAAAVGLRDVAAGEVDRVDSIIQAVRDTRTLLVLDNFEHVVSTAPIVARIIQGTSELTILATSRERLRLAGETSFAVSPLAIADVGAEHTVEAVRRSPAVQLFLDRARRIDPELDVTRESALLLVQICRAVDGLPLAIELAAALLRVFSLRELATHVTARLELLKDGPRELPERQQSLRQTITWSHDLLSPSEAALFARLSVFSGGAQVEAAEAVCSGGLGRDARTVSLLATLVDKNLLQRRRVARETRFDLLESIRDYAAERLDEREEREEVETAHAEYFLSQVVALGPKLRGVHQSRWLDYLDQEHQNIQRALEWSFGRPDSIPLALRAGPILAWFWYRRGHVSQGRRSLERLLSAAPEAATGELAACIRAAGWLAFVQGDWEAGRHHYYRALDMAQEVDDTVTRALVLGDLGVAERWLGNPGAGNRHRRGALALTQGTDDAWLRARTLIWAYATTGGEVEGQPPIAELREAQSLAARVGDAWLFAHAHNGLGDLFRRLGRLDEAHAEYSRALSGFQWVGDDWLAAWTHQGLAETFALTGNPDDAATHFRQAKQLFERVGDRSMTRHMGERYAAIAPRKLDASGSG